MQEIIKFPKLKIIDEDFKIEFEIESIRNKHEIEFSSIDNGVELLNINKKLSTNIQRIEKLNFELDNLSNSADSIDYKVAVGSGIVAGLVDSLWVGELNFERGKKWSNEEVNNFVVKTSQNNGYKGNELEGAIKNLEQKFPLSSDSNTPDFGGGLQHHLRDFSHHPTIIGLLFSMITQFTGKAYGTDTDSSYKIVDIKNKLFIGKCLPEKFLFGTVFWFFHIVSDIAGSRLNPGSGTGLPGPLLSLAKELSAIPFFKKMQIGDNSFSVWISKLFNGTLFSERDSDGKLIKDSVKGFDFRAELGGLYELGRQALPVILNECFVRGFYFIRRLSSEIKDKNIKHINELKHIEWKKTLPFKNRTIIRMLTISTGTFTLIDLSDAAIRGAIKSGGQSALFLKEFFLRVNFVGVGRFAIAITSDVAMGVKRDKRRNERIVLMSQQLHLMNTKVFYLQANMWKAAESTFATIEEAKVMMEKTAMIAVDTWKANRESMDKINNSIDGINKNNKDVVDDIIEILEWE